MEKNDENIIKKIGYVIKKLGAGIVSGTSGIGQSVLTEIDNEAEKGKEKSDRQLFIEYLQNTAEMPNHTSDLSEIKELIEENIETIKDEDKNIGEKATTILTNNVTHAVDMTIPGKKIFDTQAQAVGKYIPQAHEFVKDTSQNISETVQNMQESLNREGQNYDSTTQIVGEVGQVVGNMAPSVATAAITKDPTMAMAAMGLSSKGQATQDALQRGAELDEAIKIGNTKATVEIGTEMLFGGVNIFGKGAIDDILVKAIKDKAKNETVQRLAEKGIKVSGEVLEETLSDMMNTLIDKGTIDPNAEYTLKDFGETAIVTILSNGLINGITRGIEGNISNKENIQNKSTEIKQQTELKGKIKQITKTPNKLIVECEGFFANFDKVLEKYTNQGYVKDNISVIFDDYKDVVLPLKTVERMREKMKEYTSHISPDDDQTTKFVKSILSIKKNIQYAYNKTGDKNIGTSKNFEEGLLQGKCVCSGFSNITKMFLEAQGIESRIVTSDIHAWNQVKLGDIWYNFDPTFAKTDFAQNLGKYLTNDKQIQNKKEYKNREAFNEEIVPCTEAPSKDLLKSIKQIVKESKKNIPAVDFDKKNFMEKIAQFSGNRQEHNLALPEPIIKEQETFKDSLALPKEDIEYVNLTDYTSMGNEHIKQSDIKVKYLNGEPTYKLENMSGLIWCAQARSDNFYSDWETVQPNYKKYVQYYKLAPTTYKLKPKDLLGISNELQYMTRKNFDGEQLKNLILDYVSKKNKDTKIEHIMCEIGEATDVSDLHKLFNTPNVEEIVELYGKSFSAVDWKYIDEKDKSGFQVPTLMVMDSNCMEKTRTIRTIPYQKRKNGADKITGQNTMKINTSEILKTLNSNLTLEEVVNLLKIKRDFNNTSLINVIDDKLSGYQLLEQATQIVENDKVANNVYIITKDDKMKIQEEILGNSALQKQLPNKRLQGEGGLDSYMAVYVEMIEDVNRKKYLEPIAKPEEMKENTIKETQKQDKTRNKFKESLKENVNTEDKQLMPEFRGIEGAIQQYINSYIYLARTENIINPYKALVSIAGKAEQGQNHAIEQATMVDALRQNKYNINEQKNKNGQVAFYHIANNSYRQGNMTGNIRLYINPKRENTFELVSEILNKMGENPIYLKFMSDEQMSQTRRNEKIVIYANDTNINQVLNSINEIKKENMNLFDGCEVMNPFMKTIEGVAAYAREPSTDMYRQNDGKLRKVSKSYNTFLSNALDESVNLTMKDMNLPATNTIEGLQQLEKLMEQYPKELIQKVKLYLQKCQGNNPDIDIKGIESDIQRTTGR